MFQEMTKNEMMMVDGGYWSYSERNPDRVYRSRTVERMIYVTARYIGQKADTLYGLWRDSDRDVH